MRVSADNGRYFQVDGRQVSPGCYSSASILNPTTSGKWGSGGRGLSHGDIRWGLRVRCAAL
jgi:hypothetical protein